MKKTMNMLLALCLLCGLATVAFAATPITNPPDDYVVSIGDGAEGSAGLRALWKNPRVALLAVPNAEATNYTWYMGYTGTAYYVTGSSCWQKTR